MRQYILWPVCLSLMIVFAIGCGRDEPTDPEETNRIWLESVTASPEDHVKVDLSFSNTVALAGALMPLLISGEGYLIDSVSFIGGRFENAMLNAAQIDTAYQWISIISADTAAFVSSGSGLYASIFFYLLPESAGQEIIIDCDTIDVGNLYVIPCFLTANQSVIIPEIQEGRITVQ